MKGRIVGRPYALLILTLAVILGTARSEAQGVSVTTWHNDNLRTGQNTSETVLNPGDVNNPPSVARTTFGKLCDFDLSSIYNFNSAGWTLNLSYSIYAQPLVVANFDGSMTVSVAGHNG